MDTNYFDCKCSCGDHTIRIAVVEDNDDGPECYLEVQLNHYHSFLKRIWLGIKYVFGYESKYGHWDCTLIKDEDIPEIIGLLETCSGFSKRKNITVKGVKTK